MSDPIWEKVSELIKDYPSEFNAIAAYNVVSSAWRMGFDVVKQPAGSDLYSAAMQKIHFAATTNAYATQSQRNAMASGPQRNAMASGQTNAIEKQAARSTSPPPASE